MKVLNFGSLNIDYTYRLNHIVKPGETTSSKKLEIFPGGKGLNQSIALAKAGLDVYHAGMIGKDGAFLREICQSNGVHTSYIKEVDEATGNAVIQVSDDGQNSIILFAGANRKLTEDYIDKVLEQFEHGDILLLQNEVNMLDYLIDQGKKRGMKIVLNPSPYDRNIERCDLRKVDLFFVNEVEAGQITGKSRAEEMLWIMREMYPESGIVLTLGDKGAYYSDRTITYYQEAFKVDAIDTTAAGDTFTGYFLASYINDQSGKKALMKAAVASSMAVERKGAAVSIPCKEEVEIRLQTIE